MWDISAYESLLSVKIFMEGCPIDSFLLHKPRL
jgi:hypothetical protein